MGLYKEIHHELLELRNNQERIYPDACDEGIRVSGFNDPIVKHLKDILSNEGDYKGYSPEVIREHFKGSTMETYTSEIFIPWEVEGNYEIGVEWTIIYLIDKKGETFVQLFVGNDRRLI